MRTPFASACVGLIWLASFASPASAKPPDFEALKRTYDDLELPFPPLEAPLVVSVEGLAFRVREWTRKERGELLHGLEFDEDYGPNSRWRKIDPGELAGRGLDLLQVHMQSSDAILVAVQLWSRGESVVAQSVWSLVEKNDGDAALPYRDLGQSPPKPTDPQESLVDSAWQYWNNSLTRQGTSRPQALRLLKKMVSTYPRLASPESASLIHALELTLQPVTSKPGTPDALIDELLEVGGTLHRGVDDPMDMVHPILGIGFEAVPALLAHIDDPRLTRRWGCDELGSRMGIRTIGEVCRLLLREIAFLDHWCAGADEAKALLEWWRDHKDGDEGAYLESQALPDSPDLIWPNGTICEMLAIRHPTRLLTVYRRILKECHQFATGHVASLIAECNLPKEERVAALVNGTKSESKDKRQSAYFALSELDPDLCADLLVPVLDALPSVWEHEPPSEWGLSYPQGLASDVERVDRPRAWDALERAARRATPELCADLVLNLGAQNRGITHQRHYLEFAAKFLEDKDLFDPGYGIRKRRVCNGVAAEMASLMFMPEHPDSELADSEWDDYIARVRIEIEKLGE